MNRTDWKRLSVLLGTALMVLLATALCGCGGSSTTAANNGAFPDGAAAEYYEQTGQMKRTTSTEKTSLKDLGVPVYAGAKLENGAAQVEVATCPVGVLETTTAVLITQDSGAKVSEWYKSELSPEPGFEDHSYSHEGSEHAMYWVPSADGSRQVIIEKNPSGSGTRITAIVQKEKNK